MKMSDSIGAIGTALGLFQANVPKIEKDSTVKVRTKSGAEYSFAYATLDNVIETIRPVMAKYKLAYTHLVNENGGVMCMLIHDSGEWLASEYLQMPSEGRDAKSVGGAITYAKRYTLCAMLGITADEDDDGNTASGDEVKAKETRDDGRQWLNKNTEDWKQAVQAIKEGKRTVKQILVKRKLNKANRAELEEIEKKK